MAEPTEPHTARGPELPAALELVCVEHADGARAEAVRRARAGADEGTLVRVVHPVAPRARLDRPWLVGNHPGLHAALVLRPGLPATDCAQLGPVAVVALGRAIAAAVEPMTEMHYRWPNDVLLDGGKVAGVWLDVGGTRECIEWLVVSWALNTRAAPESLGFDAAALGVDGVTGEVDEARLLHAIARELVAAVTTWDESGFEPLLRSWRGRMIRGGALHVATPDGAHFAGTAATVHDDGSVSIEAGAASHRLGLERFFGLPEEAGP